MKSPVTSITDDQLADLEDWCARDTFKDCHTSSTTMGELRGIIARLRAAEADAIRWSLRAEVLRQLYNSNLSNEELDIAINAAMERKA